MNVVSALNNSTLREIGTIIRSLGFCPSEAELQEVTRDMETPNLVGYVHLDRFLPVVAKIFIAQRYEWNGWAELC